MGSIRSAVETCAQPVHLRRTIRIALVVGLILSLINQGNVIIGGDATALT